MMGNVLPFRPQAQVSTLRLREISRNGVGRLTTWFSDNRGARAKFRIRVQHLAKIASKDWTWQQFHSLGDGISEIKWKTGNKQFRAIGFDRDGFFVMVIGCTHKMKVYDPPECLKSAIRLKKEVENGEWDIVEFEP